MADELVETFAALHRGERWKPLVEAVPGVAVPLAAALRLLLPADLRSRDTPEEEGLVACLKGKRNAVSVTSTSLASTSSASLSYSSKDIDHLDDYR